MDEGEEGKGEWGEGWVGGDRGMMGHHSNKERNSASFVNTMHRGLFASTTYDSFLSCGPFMHNLHWRWLLPCNKMIQQETFTAVYFFYVVSAVSRRGKRHPLKEYVQEKPSVCMAHQPPSSTHLGIF